MPVNEGGKLSCGVEGYSSIIVGMIVGPIPADCTTGYSLDFRAKSSVMLDHLSPVWSGMM